MSGEAWDRERLWRYRARPIRVIDGDTIVVEADTGFYGRHEVHIRIADLNAPELNEPGGEEAAIRLRQAIDSPSEWSLRVVTRQRETVVSEVRSFERYVGDVLVVGDAGGWVDVKGLL